MTDSKPHSDRHARLMRGEITVDEYVAEVKSDVNERLAAWREVALAHKASDQERGQRIIELVEQSQALRVGLERIVRMEQEGYNEIQMAQEAQRILDV